MKFVILGGQRGIVEDIKLSLHDRHGHIGRPIFCYKISLVNGHSQCAEMILNKVAKTINQTFTDSKCMLQGSVFYCMKS